jgi:1-acyl-sn-glycerol-3-phosphate acyltransferase
MCNISILRQSLFLTETSASDVLDLIKHTALKVISTILLVFWAAWCALVFVVLCAILFPVLLLAVLSGSDRIIRAAHFVPTRLARVAIFLFGIGLEIRGREYIDPHGQYVYISNHRSLLDAVIAGAVIPNYVKFLGKAEMLQWPVLGYLLAKFYVPVQRQDSADRARSMQIMEEKIKTGCSFFICPESTCNTTTAFLTRFYNGAFRLSADTGVSLVPLTFVGSGDRWPRKGRQMIHPGKLIVYFHPAIPASEFQEDKLAAGREKVENIIRADLLRHYPSGSYAP